MKHKLVHEDNVLRVIQECMRSTRGGDYQYAVKKRIIGQTVMTGYNNKSYRSENLLNLKHFIQKLKVIFFSQLMISISQLHLVLENFQ